MRLPTLLLMSILATLAIAACRVEEANQAPTVGAEIVLSPTPSTPTPRIGPTIESEAAATFRPTVGAPTPTPTIQVVESDSNSPLTIPLTRAPAPLVLDESPLPTISPRISPTPTATPRVPPTRVAVGPRVGQRAPDFSVTTVDGEELTLADFQGQPLILYFFAAW